ncbi:hypothetical protein GOODEAATRI_009454 [Goodea atripinnis]|uniref:Uncharacterized protein n=1 Tax=Goodea atripinnis TaxID=208336 RepID=A0ABV0NJ44_9TELE
MKPTEQSEDLLWNDFEEKISDQLVRTMENYTSQFPEVKEYKPPAECTAISKCPTFSKIVEERDEAPSVSCCYIKNHFTSYLSFSGLNTPQRQSVCDDENSDKSTRSQSPEDLEAEAELATNQSDDSGVGVPKSEAANQEPSSPSGSADGDDIQSLDQGTVGNLSLEEAEPRPHPVPPLRQSFHSTDQQPLLPEKDGMETSNNPETSEPGDDSNSQNPPGFLYKVLLTAFQWLYTSHKNSFWLIFVCFTNSALSPKPDPV